MTQVMRGRSPGAQITLPATGKKHKQPQRSSTRRKKGKPGILLRKEDRCGTR